MNVVDLILIVIILLSVFSGYRKGFIVGSANLLTWAGSLLAGFLFYPYLASLFQKYIPALGVWTLPLSFILVIVFARIALSLLLSPLLQQTGAEVHGHGINKFLGIIPGFVNGLFNAIIIAALLLATPLFRVLSAEAKNSRLANKFVVPAEWLEDKLSPVFSKAVDRSLNNLMIEPKSNESVTLDFKVAHPAIRSDLEAQMLDLVNKERLQHRLPPLKADPELTAVARAHSRDMFVRGYFAHVDPDGKDPFDRIKEAKIKFLSAGENLALAPTLIVAHNGLMNSPGHRANILQPSFGRVGIGILDGGIYGIMVTQNFRN
jgi:uncharacterized protein YkwD